MWPASGTRHSRAESDARKIVCAVRNARPGHRALARTHGTPFEALTWHTIPSELHSAASISARGRGRAPAPIATQSIRVTVTRPTTAPHKAGRSEVFAQSAPTIARLLVASAYTVQGTLLAWQCQRWQLSMRAGQETGVGAVCAHMRSHEGQQLVRRLLVGVAVPRRCASRASAFASLFLLVR